MERAELSRWLSTLGCAETRGGFVFLRDPHWSEDEVLAADAFMRAAEGLAPPKSGWICVRTGGSGGGLKFARHDERTFHAALGGFASHFRLRQVNAVGVLPPWHVSGLMARYRGAATGGRYVDVAWKSLEAGERPSLAGDWVISLVPTQLYRLLGHPEAVDWLRGFRIVFLGGGPVWRELTDAAAAARIPVALSYGMTETAAMIAAQRPAEFAAGDRSSGSIMPHAQVTLTESGCIRISGESVFRGYFPDELDGHEFVTEDLGEVDANRRLHVLGRRDAMIITGGRKVQPLDVEAALRASGEFSDVAVIGVPDAEWGEVVVAFYPASSRPPDVDRAVAKLAPHQRPKRFVALTDWPRNAQGKINRAALRARVESA
jgi:O-succinylbenzoic acid--CoA ligase